MSKASDYAKAINNKPEYKIIDKNNKNLTESTLSCEVSIEGNLFISNLSERIINPEQAVELGQWLLNTFGDSDPVQIRKSKE